MKEIKIRFIVIFFVLPEMVMKLHICCFENFSEKKWLLCTELVNTGHNYVMLCVFDTLS